MDALADSEDISDEEDIYKEYPVTGHLKKHLRLRSK